MTETPSFCKLSVDEFSTGRQIKFNIFARLADNKFVRIAHQGEDISAERIQSYKSKGLYFLYLRRDDFCQYVGFAIELANSIKKSSVAQEKKMELLRHTGSVLSEQVRHEGIGDESFDSAKVFLEAAIDLFTTDVQACELIQALRDHTDHLFAHCLGVSIYSVMIAQTVGWNMPTNKFKIALGGLLHDIGHNEMEKTVLMKPKHAWTPLEVDAYKNHPLAGFERLDTLKCVPEDIKQIVRQHHENCRSNGFPSQLKRTSIHPMAKLISVADEFCRRIIQNPENESMTPADALQEMHINCAETLDKSFLKALTKLFTAPAPGPLDTSTL